MITCEYRELNGANVYSQESVLVGLLATDVVEGTLEWPSEILERCAARLDALGLSASEIRERQRWPLGLLVQSIAEQLVRRSVGPGATRPAGPQDPARELVLMLEPRALTRAGCQLAIALVSASATAITAQDPRALLDAFDQAHKPVRARTAALVAACRQRDIPWHPMDSGPAYIQFGEGVLQERTWWLASTRKAAMDLTRDKAMAHRMLSRFGVPVARQAALTDPARAWEIATAIGLPVVVKPRRGKHGQAVSAGLNTRAEVEAAVQRVRQVEAWALIESFIAGDDHRVMVAGGRVVAVIQRLPASVVGDGTSTIDELLARANADPRRTSDKRTPLNPIHYDSESERVLRSAGLTRESVPASGVRVRLKSAANWAEGGSLHDVTDAIHPDNAEMCVRAIEACGVDLGGADFVTLDVARSYRDIGGALCEVNSLPSLDVVFAEGAGDRNVVGDVLDALYPNDRRWRLPTVVVCGEDPEAVARGVAAALSASWGLTVGYAGASGTTIGRWVVAAERQPVHVAHRVLIEDPTTEAVVVAVTSDQVLSEGTGIARADVVALVDDHDPRVSQALERTGAAIVLGGDQQAIADLLTRSCRRPPCRSSPRR